MKNKKWIRSMAVLLSAFLLAETPMTSIAAEITEKPQTLQTLEQFTYKPYENAPYEWTYVIKNDEITILKTTGTTEGELLIPEMIDGIKVTGIGSGAFTNCTGFTGDLVIPKNITTIGSNAFYGCTGFDGKLVLPDSITAIPKEAFHGCNGLNGELVLPDSITTIGAYAFTECTGFSGALKIPDGVTEIGLYAFSKCTGFTGDLVIPDSVAVIGGSAFGDCTGFDGKLVLSDNVTEIGSMAFGNCSNLKGNLVLPDTLTNIGIAAFYECSGLTGKLVLPAVVETIGNTAFYGCTGFEGDLIIPESVTFMGKNVFYQCSGLNKKVYFASRKDNAAYDMDPDAFSFYEASKSEITICAPADSYARTYAIKNGYSYEEGEAPAILKDTIWQEDYTYTIDAENATVVLEKYNGDAAELIVPGFAVINGVRYTTSFVTLGGLGSTGQEESIWAADKNLEKLSFESGALLPENSMYHMFFGCENLKTLDISNLDTSRVTDMSGLCGNCLNLESINFGENFDTDNVLNMSGMFSNCYKLSELDLGKFSTWNTRYFVQMFSNCSSLKQIDISKFGMRDGGMYGMFDGCTSLESIDLSRLDLSNMIVGRLFDGDINLKEIRTPLKLKDDVLLPGIYQDAEGNTYEYLPKDATESVLLTRIADEDKIEETASYYGEVTPLLFDAAIKYLNDYYLKKYPGLGLEVQYGSAHDEEILQKLADTITENCVTDAEKADAIMKWVQGNVEYSKKGEAAYVYPLDVFRYRKATCVGYTLLTTQLLRQAGIPAATCSGYVSFDSDFASFDEMPIDTALFEGHEWTMAYFDGSWYLIDTLFNTCSNDWDNLAKGFYISDIEGVSQNYEGRVLTRTLDHYVGLYTDGRVMMYENGKPASETMGTSLTKSTSILAGNDGKDILIVDYTTIARYFDNWGADSWEYMDNPERKNTMLKDECYADGWVSFLTDERPTKKVRANGVGYNCTIREKDGIAYYLQDSRAIPLPGNSKDYTLTNGLLTLLVGESFRIDLAIKPALWTSSDEEIATINAEGVVTAKKEGRVRLEYYTEGGGSGRIEIWVADELFTDWDYTNRVTEVILDENSLSLAEGESAVLTATVMPDNATDKSVTWTSSDEAVATVDGNGKVTALKAGNADITVTTSNGKTATCYVNVTAKVVDPDPDPEPNPNPDPDPDDKPDPTPDPDPDPEPDPDPTPDVSFKDVDEASWQYEGINYVCKKGAMQGVSAISFKPEGNITRGQLVTILHRLDGEPEMEYKDIFPDVTDPTMYYIPGVMWAAKTGVTTGYPDGKFGPEDSIQRQQLATMLYRFAEYKGFDVSMKASFDDFADADKVETWSEDAMKWAVANKIIGGKPSKNGTIIDPAGTATRAECAKMLMFFMEAYNL